MQGPQNNLDIQSQTHRKVCAIKMKEIEVRFVDNELREKYEKLKLGSGDDIELYNRINKVIQVLKRNPEAGIRIQKRLIPKVYIQKHGIDNLWKYDIGKRWRLFYTITQNEVRIISIILEWLKHKDYERRFGY